MKKILYTLVIALFATSCFYVDKISNEDRTPDFAKSVANATYSYALYYQIQSISLLHKASEWLHTADADAKQVLVDKYFNKTTPTISGDSILIPLNSWNSVVAVHNNKAITEAGAEWRLSRYTPNEFNIVNNAEGDKWSIYELYIDESSEESVMHQFWRADVPTEIDDYQVEVVVGKMLPNYYIYNPYTNTPVESDLFITTQPLHITYSSTSTSYHPLSPLYILDGEITMELLDSRGSVISDDTITMTFREDSTRAFDPQITFRGNSFTL